MKYLLSLVLAAVGIGFAYTPVTYDRLLNTYVDDEGLVDYAAWSAVPEDVAALQDFIGEMVVYDPGDLDRDEELAFWINAYNALTLDAALQRYPTGSIRPSFLGIPDLSFFKEQVHVVNGKTYSLDGIENGVIRELGEPRIHFAINCASQSCPALLPTAYEAEELDAQLDAQAVRFVNDPARNRFDAATDTAFLSKIFDWFEKDFDAVGGVSTYLAQFAEGEAKEVLTSDGLSIDYLSYDWGLNAQQ